MATSLYPTFQIMDELTEKLAGSFNVTLEQNSTAAQHPRFAQYKCKSKVDQETRRKRILDEQKKYLLIEFNIYTEVQSVFRIVIDVA